MLEYDRAMILTCVVAYTYTHTYIQTRSIQINALPQFVLAPNTVIILLYVAIHFLTVTFNSLSVNYHILSHSQHITSGPHNSLKDRVCVGG